MVGGVLMAGRAAQAPRASGQAASILVDDPKVERALSEMRSAVEALQAGRQRDVVQVDLVVGTNKIRHGLGRDATGYAITPTVAAASFAHALDRTNPRPEIEVWIIVIGVAQPRAVVEVM